MCIASSSLFDGLVVFHRVAGPPFAQSPADGYLGCFQVFTVTNKEAISICVHVFKRTHAFSSVGYIPGGGMAVSRGRYTLHCVRSRLSALQGDLFTLQPRSQCAGLSEAPPSSPHLVQPVYSV